MRLRSLDQRPAPMRDAYPLFQMSSFIGVHTKMDPKFEVVTMVRRLAQTEHSTALSQFVSRISDVVKFGAGVGEESFAEVKKLITDSTNRSQAESSSEANAGENPFADVKGLIADLIADLVDRLQLETSHKSHCDDELMKASVKEEDFETQVETHSFKLEEAILKPSALDGEVAELHADLGFCTRAVLETSGDKSFPVRRVIDLLKKMQAELTQDAANDQVIMVKMGCRCVTNHKDEMEVAADASERLNKNQLTENDDIEAKQKRA